METFFEFALIVLVLGFGIDYLKKRLFGGGGSGSSDPTSDPNFIRGAAVSAHKKAVSEGALCIAGHEIPEIEVPRHVIVSGTTGSGKSQAIQGWISGIFDRLSYGGKAILTDSGGAMMSRFGSENDLILNVFDGRTRRWNPFNEILVPELDIPRICESIVTDRQGEEGRWAGRARNLLIDYMTVSFVKGRTSPREAVRIITSADTSELKSILSGTPSEAITSKENSEFFGSIQGVLAESIRYWRYLDDDGTFSLRDWIKSDMGSVLWLTYSDESIATMRYLVSCWVDILITEILSGQEADGLRFFLICDELDSLGRIPTLANALTRGRKYGLSALAAIQSIAQLRTTYGKDPSQTLLSCYVSKLILQQGSFEDAKYWSDELGQAEIIRPEESESENSSSSSHKTKFFDGSRQSGTSKSTNYRRIVEQIVLPSELQNLRPLSGYLKIGSDPITKYVSLPYKKISQKIDPFIPKN